MRTVARGNGALQIVLATGEFRPGRHTRSEGWAVDWARQEN